MLLQFIIIKLRKPNFVKLSLIVSKIFIGVVHGGGKPDFREGKVENSAQTRKLPNFRGI